LTALASDGGGIITSLASPAEDPAPAALRPRRPAARPALGFTRLRPWTAGRRSAG